MVLLSDDQRGSMPAPSLVRLDVESGSASTLHEFSQCENYCRPVLHGFAWSPDGTHVAVTSGEGISVLDSDGTFWNGRPPQGAPDMTYDHVRCLTAQGALTCGANLQVRWTILR